MGHDKNISDFNPESHNSRKTTPISDTMNRRGRTLQALSADLRCINNSMIEEEKKNQYSAPFDKDRAEDIRTYTARRPIRRGGFIHRQLADRRLTNQPQVTSVPTHSLSSRPGPSQTSQDLSAMNDETTGHPDLVSKSISGPMNSDPQDSLVKEYSGVSNSRSAMPLLFATRELQSIIRAAKLSGNAYPDSPE